MDGMSVAAAATVGSHREAARATALADDEAACVGAGLAGKVPNSRRLGEYLTLFSDSALQRLQDCMRSVSERVVPLVAKACYREQGYVPVFIDGTGIEVQGKHFEKAAVGYNGERQYSLRAVFVGRAWASARLHGREGGTLRRNSSWTWIRCRWEVCRCGRGRTRRTAARSS